MMALSEPARSQSVLPSSLRVGAASAVALQASAFIRFMAQIEQSHCRVPNSCPINRATAVTHGY